MAKVHVYVTLKPTLLDAQGKVVQTALSNLGYKNVEEVRMGKYIQLDIDDGNGRLEQDIDEMCRRLLSNPVIEDYRFEVVQDEETAK